jgi:voltage-gated potassium channel
MTPLELYETAAFWAFTTVTTIGYGDIFPTCIGERVVAMFSMLIACAVFAFIVGMLGSLFDKSDSVISEFK